jgi:putative DNA primase/helicase
VTYQNIQDAANALTRGGFCIVPLKIDGSKEPSVKWKEYQLRKPPVETVWKWFGNGVTRGIAAIQGKISGNSETIDFDDPELFEPFGEEVEKFAPGLLARIVQTRTPRPGYQITYRCRVIGRNRGLAFGERPARPDDDPNSVYENDDGEFVVRYATIETRGEGGYIVAVGSPARVHKNNKPYEFINGDYEHVPEITPEERDTIFAICQGLSQVPIPAESESEDRARMRRERKPGALLAGDDYNERGDNKAILEKHGWQYKKDDQLGELWTRPGKDTADGHSARLWPNGNLLIFTSNGGRLKQGECYSPFAQFAELEHGGDYKVAAKALYKLGFGSQDEATSSDLDEPSVDQEPAANPDPAVAVAHCDVLDSILEKVDKLDFSILFKGIDAVKQKHYLVASIEQLLTLIKVQQYQLARKNDFVFAFNGEYWKEIDRDGLKDFLMAVAQKQGIAPFEAKHYEFRDKLYKQFIALAGIRPPEPSDDKVLINLLNGTFEISAERQAYRIRDFCAADFLTHQLQFKYDKDATAPKFQAYLNRVLPEQELQDIIAEFFGYVFTKNLKLEKALLPYGTGANGKSVLFDVMNGLLGRENTANYSLSDLMEEHNRAQIAHKLLNYGSEINASLTRDVLKNLISCEPIMARLKYGNSFLMEKYAKLCFNCNELPKDVEQTEAYFRRFLIIPFRVTLPESEWDVELAQKIVKDELAGVFNWVLAGLGRLLKQKKFTESKIVREMIAEYKRESDSVACFLRDENWGPDPHNPDHTTPLKKLHLSYQSYCREAGHKPLGRNNFKKRLAVNRVIEATKAGCSQEFYINHLGGRT